MLLQKKLGKTKLEVKLTTFQAVAILIWVIVLLILPITIHQIGQYRESLAVTQQSDGIHRNRVAGAVTQEESFFTYTVNFTDKKQLVSTLTFIFGSISAVIAVISLVYLIKQQLKKDKSVFSL